MSFFPEDVYESVRACACMLVCARVIVIVIVVIVIVGVVVVVVCSSQCPPSKEVASFESIHLGR